MHAADSSIYYFVLEMLFLAIEEIRGNSLATTFACGEYQHSKRSHWARRLRRHTLRLFWACCRGVNLRRNTDGLGREAFTVQIRKLVPSQNSLVKWLHRILIAKRIAFSMSVKFIYSSLKLSKSSKHDDEQMNQVKKKTRILYYLLTIEYIKREKKYSQNCKYKRQPPPYNKSMGTHTGPLGTQGPECQGQH